jgi:hypothetical protein
VKTFSKEEFAVLKATFEENNPKLANSPDAIRQEIKDLEIQMADLLRDKPEGFEPAIRVLWQGRNFLALYIGNAEKDLPAMEEQEEAVDPLEGKHVAVFSSGKTVLAAIAKVLATCSTLRFERYSNISSLLTAILQGRVCGVVALHGERARTGAMEQYLRHDLKSLPGWDYKGSQDAVLPHCVDFFVPYMLGEVLTVMAQLQGGTYRPVRASEDFSLAQELPSLLGHMACPLRDLVVLVVDDMPEEVQGMMQILRAWPKVSAQFLAHVSGMPKVPEKTDLLLLDEGLKEELTGTVVAAALKRQCFAGVIVSTTAGEKPAFTPWHFGLKGQIAKDQSAALAFVQFMNLLIEQVK